MAVTEGKKQYVVIECINIFDKNSVYFINPLTLKAVPQKLKSNLDQTLCVFVNQDLFLASAVLWANIDLENKFSSWSLPLALFSTVTSQVHPGQEFAVHGLRQRASHSNEFKTGNFINSKKKCKPLEYAMLRWWFKIKMLDRHTRLGRGEA